MEEVILPGPFLPVVLERVDSTNEEAKRRAAAGAPDGTLVWAGEQTAGRGRGGRGWESAPGNLYCSLLLRPDYPAAQAMQLGFVTANTVADTVAAALPRSAAVTCKWPNDVLVEGHKIAGILLESEAEAGGGLAWVVIGVGINITDHPTAGESRYPATSLDAEGAETITPGALLASYCRHLQSAIAVWRRVGFAAVRGAWLRRAHGLGGAITVRLQNETLDGTFEDLDADGALVLGQAGGPRRITVGDVFPMGR